MRSRGLKDRKSKSKVKHMSIQISRKEKNRENDVDNNWRNNDWNIFKTDKKKNPTVLSFRNPKKS